MKSVDMKINEYLPGIKVLLPIILIFVLITGCARLSSRIQQDFDEAHTIHLSKFNEFGGNISEYAVFLDKGDILPVVLSIDNEFASAREEKINLVIKRRIYFWIDIPQGIESMNEKQRQQAIKKVRGMLSSDAKTWASTSGGIEGLKDILGIKKGSISIGASITKENGIGIDVNISTAN